jgi:hypothetical protein
LDDDVVLTFAARAVDTVFTGATDPPHSPERPFYLSNRLGVLDAGVGRPHAGSFAEATDQVRLVSPRSVLRFDGVSQSDTLRILDAAGAVLRETTVVPTDGLVEIEVDLRPWAPGLFEVQLGEGIAERIYADVNLPAQRPVAILELVLRPAGNEGFPILEAAGEPADGGRTVRTRWRARATAWRYIVVPRSDPGLEPADLRLQHTSDDGTPFEFAPAGTQHLPAEGVGAILFESTTLIGHRAIPYRGLALESRSGAGTEFVAALTDLPNPRPETLSLASTAARPISEVFVYL